MAEEILVSKEDHEEYEARLTLARSTEDKVSSRVLLLNGTAHNVIWSPQEGSQTAFMACPYFEALYHGTRGPGKTDALIMSFTQHVGKGFGAAWSGIIFRQTYPQLADVQAKTEKWFRQIFPSAKFNRSKMQWEFATGERLLLRHMNRPADYWNYHGHEYPFIGFEELCNWATPDCYVSMFACCRCSTPGVPRMVRATTNPYGPGHHWVKARFKLSGQWWKTVTQLAPLDEEGRPQPSRSAIHGHISENKILLAADPDYKKTIVAAAANKAMVVAWLSGSWDIVAGGMFGEVWSAKYNIVPRFKIPGTWRLDRSFDWGSSKPFSVGWWAESDGSDLLVPCRGVISTVRGDLYRFNEWYGCTGRPNEGLTMLATEIAKGIIEREVEWGLRGQAADGRIISLVKPGPADRSIYDVENGMSIGVDMAKKVRVKGVEYNGVHWTEADKRPGSRVAGWEAMRIMMKHAHPNEDGKPREKPGLFVMEHCEHFIRTVPTLPRSEKNMDDVDTEAEDHIGDETRYRVRSALKRVVQGGTTGMF